jgi:iron complex outermembrane recepter protein
VRVRMGHNDYMHQELEADGAVGTTFLNDEYEGRIELSHEPIANIDGVVGVQVQHRNFSAVGEEQLTPPVAGRAVGVFVLEERDIEQLHVQFGARYDNVANAPETAINPATWFDIYSVSAGVVWHFMPSYGVGLSFTRGQRAPGFEELYNNGPHDATNSFEHGDATLREETANALDWTLHKEDGRLQWALNLFVNYMEDFVFQHSVDASGDGRADSLDADGLPVTPGSGFLLLEYAQADALFYGAEAEVGYGLLHDSRWGELDARLFADYVRGRLTDGDNLPRMTPLRFGGGLDYHLRAWHADFDVRRSAAQGEQALLETSTGGYTLVDAGVSYTIKSAQAEYIVSARGSNLLDEEVRYHTSLLKAVAPQPGRSARLSLQVNFD